MAQPFDHSRYDWYPPFPTKYGGAPLVTTSSGSPRPALKIPLTEFVVHYGGAGTNWTDYGDTVNELRNVEQYARGQNKPNEYNSVSDTASETWEYSGRYLSAGNGIYNPTTWSHLALYGLENLTEAEAQGLIAGIRRARAQCVEARYLTPNHVVRPHNHYKQTSCPGPLWTNKRWWGQIIAPLTAPAAPVVPPSPIPGGSDVINAIQPFRNSDTRVYGGAGIQAAKPGEFGLNPDLFPANTVAAAFNVTVIPTTSLGGFLTVWPNGSQKPNASCVNFGAGENGVPTNGAIVVGIDGLKWMLELHGSSAHVIFDVTAYWTVDTEPATAAYGTT